MLVVAVAVAMLVLSLLMRLGLRNIGLLLCGEGSQWRGIRWWIVLYAVSVWNCTVLGKLHKGHGRLAVGRGDAGDLSMDSNVSLMQGLLKGLHVDMDLLLQLGPERLVYSLGLCREQSRKTAGYAVDDARGTHHATAEEDPKTLQLGQVVFHAPGGVLAA